MSREHIRFEELFHAPRAQVFAFLAKLDNWSRAWQTPMRRLKAGDDPSQLDGLGSVREVKTRGVPAFEETILVFDPPSRIEYSVSSGSPVKNHRGVLIFEDAGTDTRLIYTIAFDPKIPFTGGVIARSTRHDWTRGLAKIRREIETG